MTSIRYRALHGYKYLLGTSYSCETGIVTDERRVVPTVSGEDAWVSLEPDGTLHVREGYAWDGPSGPAPDWPSMMRASLVHDALYQLLRRKELAPRHRDAADRLFETIATEDGLPPWVAHLAYRTLKWFAAPAADPAQDRPTSWTCAPTPCPTPEDAPSEPHGPDGSRDAA